MKKLALIIAAIAATVTLAGCYNLEQKAVSVNTTADGIKVETAGSASTGTVLPNLCFAELITQVATVPVLPATDKDGKPNVSQVLYQKTVRNSFLGSVFGIDNKTTAITYIGPIGESADDTVKRVNALGGLDSSTKADSAVAGAK